MKSPFSLPCLLLVLLYASYAAGDAPANTLDALHEAGTKADPAVFASLLTADAVVLGFEGQPRLAGDALRARINASFTAGRAWRYRATERDIRYSPAGDVAWFDEFLAGQQGRSGWGTGVLVRTSAGWRVAQYNLNLSPDPGVPAVATSTAAAPAAAVSRETEAPEKKECRQLRHKTNKVSSC